MKQAAILILFAALFSACEKNDDNNTPHNAALENGRYIGIFHRTGMDTANISLTISGNHFEGSSDRNLYPALCKGSYTTDGVGINFGDSCTWQANFDWSLILNGRYELSKNGNEIRIKRENNGITDEYQLMRLVR
jgi:hypothetical protein